MLSADHLGLILASRYLQLKLFVICIFLSGGEVESGPGSGAATPTTLNPAQRKKKPKRRSTGVVNIDFDVSSGDVNKHFCP